MELENITSKRRRYDDACAATHAMDLFGERWALPVMRELMLGPRRFSELKASINGISANVLTQRLEGLEAAGVVRRVKLPPPASVQVYELTAWGYEAGPIFQAMGRWAAKSPRHDPAAPFSPVSLMLSLRTMMNPERARGLRARIGFRIGGEQFLLEIDGGPVALARGPADGADLVLTGGAREIAAIVYGGAPLESVEVAGDRRLARRFVELFPLPDKAPLPSPPAGG